MDESGVLNLESVGVGYWLDIIFHNLFWNFSQVFYFSQDFLGIIKVPYFKPMHFNNTDRKNVLWKRVLFVAFLLDCQQ